MRLKTTKEKDELNELAQNFNGMLERLENSFDSQKHFVSNISHELRTPLSAIITELELASAKDKTKEEYRETIQYALDDARNMVKLSNSLMDLAKASYDPNEISFSEVRLDEVLLESYTKITKENSGYKVSLNIEDSVEEHQLIIQGNEYLLQVAFNNLIDNACKYSPEHTCLIDVNTNSKFLQCVLPIPAIALTKKIYNIFLNLLQKRNVQTGKGPWNRIISHPENYSAP